MLKNVVLCLGSSNRPSNRNSNYKISMACHCNAKSSVIELAELKLTYRRLREIVEQIQCTTGYAKY